MCYLFAPGPRHCVPRAGEALSVCCCVEAELGCVGVMGLGRERENVSAALDRGQEFFGWGKEGGKRTPSARGESCPSWR